MGDLVDLGDYREQKTLKELEELQEKLHTLAENMNSTDFHGYYTSVEDALKETTFNISGEEEQIPEPGEFSTSRWEHFKQCVLALWLALRHFWRLIWGPTYETFD